jgi:hypothetical protein
MNPTIADLRRELEKALETLQACAVHLARHAEMNAALHVSDRVMYSPLYAKVEATMSGIGHALHRTAEPEVPTLDHTSPDGPWAALVADLDRCMHGRHSQDPCGSCGGQSKGNHHLPPGRVFGYGLRLDQIVVPAPEDRHNPAAWRRAAVKPDGAK